MASTNTLPVPKLTHLGWQSGFNFFYAFFYVRKCSSRPHPPPSRPWSCPILSHFWPIPRVGSFIRPSFLRSTGPFALLESVFTSLGASSLHKAARVVPALVSSFTCPTSSFSNPSVFPFEPAPVSFQTDPRPLSVLQCPPGFETGASPFNPAD